MIPVLNDYQENVFFEKYDRVKLYENIQTEDYPTHWHTSLEIIMPVDNGYQITYEGTEYNIVPGDIAIIAPGVVHSLNAPDTGKRYILQAELSALKEIAGVDSILSFMDPVTILSNGISKNVYSKIHPLLSNLIVEYQANMPFSEVSIFSAILSILYIVGKEHVTSKSEEVSTGTKRQEYADTFMNICDYINDNFAEDLTLESVAEMANFSKFHFSRLFKDFTNVSFYKYVNQTRINYAKSLLLKPDISITEVAVSSGFSTSSAFIRMFKQLTGCTPTQYKKIYRDLRT